MRAPRRPAGGASGFSLIELLVAVALAGVVTCAGWSWCWSVSRSCANARDRLEALSSIGFVRRLTTRELSAATRLLNTPSCSCTNNGLAFAVPTPDGRGLQEVTYGWNAARGIVWRKASGSHLVEGATRFDVCYADQAGRGLACGSDGRLDEAARPAVRTVELTLTVVVGRQAVTRRWRVALPAGTS